MPKRSIKQDNRDKALMEFTENVFSFIEASKYTGRTYDEQLNLLIEDEPSQEVYWKLLCQRAKDLQVQ